MTNFYIFTEIISDFSPSKNNNTNAIDKTFQDDDIEKLQVNLNKTWPNNRSMK